MGRNCELTVKKPRKTGANASDERGQGFHPRRVGLIRVRFSEGASRP
jgi:hypothetical protein